MARRAAAAKVIELRTDQVDNSAGEPISFEEPFTVEVTLSGSAPYLYHRWNNEEVEAKAKAPKNSAAKKTDNVDSYVWRDDNKNLCIPGHHLNGAIVAAAKFRQDPRSPRKSAQDLYKAGITVLTDVASVGRKSWDYLDRRRVTVQRQGVTRTRPALKQGWQATFQIMVLLPEYISEENLRSVIEQAGRLCGVGDFRPSHGRFGVVKYKRIAL